MQIRYIRTKNSSAVGVNLRFSGVHRQTDWLPTDSASNHCVSSLQEIVSKEEQSIEEEKVWKEAMEESEELALSSSLDAGGTEESLRKTSATLSGLGAEISTRCLASSTHRSVPGKT